MMRLATHETQWLRNKSDEIIGIALGFDFCAEHQFGMDDLCSALGIPEGTLRGLESRKINALPNEFGFTEFQRKPKDKTKAKQACAILVCYARNDYNEELWTLIQRAKKTADFWQEEGNKYFDPSRHNIAAAWDQKSFAILVRGDSNIEALQNLYAAFKRHDIVLAPAQPAGCLHGYSSGLTFAMDSKIDDQTRAKVLENDLDELRLMEAVKRTAIKEVLIKANKRWHTLFPAWANEEKTAVKFYLNPRDQERYEGGWYSVPDLEAWAREEGPVLKKS